MRITIALLLANCLLSSCDPPAWLTIKNKSGGHAIYRYEFMEQDSAKTVTFEFSDKEDRNEVNILFGFWQFWTDERITEYVATINKIEIMSRTDTLLLQDKTEMFNFFKKRRRGLLKQQITIKI